MMDEPYLMECVKEALSFVSQVGAHCCMMQSEQTSSASTFSFLPASSSSSSSAHWTCYVRTEFMSCEWVALVLPHASPPFQASKQEIQHSLTIQMRHNKISCPPVLAHTHSQDVVQDLKMAAKGSRSPHKREFVLPDGVSNFRGYIKVSMWAATMPFKSRHCRRSAVWNG